MLLGKVPGFFKQWKSLKQRQTRHVTQTTNEAMSLYNLSLVSKKTVSHPSPAEIQEIHATNMHHFDDTRCPTTRSRFIKPSHLPTNIYIYTHDKPLFYKFYTYIHIFTIKILWLQANLAGCYG